MPILMAHDPIQIHACGRQVTVVQRLLDFSQGFGVLTHQCRERVASLMHMYVPEAGIQCVSFGYCQLNLRGEPMC